MRIWIDIENPPQVQYLTPLAAAFAAQGAEVVVTARDYGSTFALLEARGVPFHRLGSSYGKEKWRKAKGLLGRTAMLARFLARRRPDAAVHAGRASALAASSLRVPSFSFRDYEYVNLAIDRLTRSFVVFPDAIDAASFTEQGVRADRLLPFAGLKEDLSFAGIDPAEIKAYDLGAAGDGLVRVLVRPPAEESHYYSSESGRVFQALLGAGDVPGHVVQGLQVLVVVLAGDEPLLDVALDGATIVEAQVLGFSISAHGRFSYHMPGPGERSPPPDRRRPPGSPRERRFS